MTTSSKKILVTGVAGFLGSHLAEKLSDMKHKVIGIDNMVGGYKDNVPKNIEFFKIDNHDNWKRFIESNDEEYSGGHPTSEHNKILSDKLYEYINA